MRLDEKHVEVLLRQQWNHLLEWLDGVDVRSEMPTGLGDWTVADLVAHLGLGLGLALHVRGTDSSPTVTTVGHYIASYPAASEEIAKMTRDMRLGLAPAMVDGLRDIGERVWVSLARQPGRLLIARRGTMARADYLVTRLIELVVHGDDLWRTLGGNATPVLPAALRVVSSALAQAYRERTPRDLPIRDDIEWIRLACGRLPSADPDLPLL